MKGWVIFMKKKLENAVKRIECLLKESDSYAENSSAGYDEGWCCGESNAYSKVLDILKNILDEDGKEQ